MIESGLKKGDRVLLLVPLSVETFVLLLALFRIGAVAVIADSSFGLNYAPALALLVQPDVMISSSTIKSIAIEVFSEIRKIPLELDVQQLVSINGTAIKSGTINGARQKTLVLKFRISKANIPH